MFAKSSKVVVILFIVSVSDCQRKIQDGILLQPGEEKRYVVYLVRAPQVEKRYDSWLCGGAIIASQYVISSAACVTEVEYMFVIAGYNKYVTDDEIDTDPCTRQKKKRVIYSCFPAYYNKGNSGAEVDIAILMTDSPFDFEDKTYNRLCSYIPGVISVNFEIKFEQTETDAIVMGWGHKWRKKKDYNQKYLSYAPVSIMNKEECKRIYIDYVNMTKVIESYMICTNGGGRFDANGQYREEFGEIVDRCKNSKYEHKSCEESGDDDVRDKTRRNIEKANLTHKETSMEADNKTVFRTSINETIDFNKTVKLTRKFGICQNDFGSPLVTWVGTHEVLIGIASVFSVTEDNSCTGPYLYTSTMSNGNFIDCIILHAKLPQYSEGQRYCKSSNNDEQILVVERHVSWLRHPYGPADNEKQEASPTGRIGPKIYPQNDLYANTPKQTHVINQWYQINDNYAANERHTVKDKYYAHDERYTTKENFYTPDERFSTKDIYYTPVERYAIKSNYYTPDERYPIKPNYYTPDERYPIRGQYYTPDERYAMQQNYYTPDERYPVRDQYYTPDERYAIKQNYYTPDQRYPMRDQYYTPDVRYPIRDQYYTPDERYAIKQNYYTPDERYPMRDQYYTPDVRYPMRDQYYTPDERYAIKQNYYTPDERYPMRDQYYTPDVRYPIKESFATAARFIVKHNYVTSGWYLSTTYRTDEKYPQNNHYIPNEMYRVSEQHAVSEGYIDHSNLATTQRSLVNTQYPQQKDKVKNAEKTGEDPIVLRPQISIQN